MIRILHVVGVIILTCMHVYSASVPEKDAQMLLEENFDTYKDGTLPDGWWVEGGEKVAVENGRLRIQADGKGPGHGTCTVWNKTKLSGDIQISYDTHVLSSRKDVNNLNFFLFYSDPSGKPLFDTRNEKDRVTAKYSAYHDLNGYIFTFLNAKKPGSDAPGSEKTGRIRIRRCPGFNLINEKFGYHCEQRTTYHITFTRKGNKLMCDVDNGKFSLTVEDKETPHAEGLLGFRTWATDFWVDNFTVKQLNITHEEQDEKKTGTSSEE